MASASLTSLTGQLTGAIGIGLASGLAGAGSTADMLTELRVALATPTLSYVPIYCETVKQSRRASVSTSMLISQTEGTKQYFTDNIAPQPRTWVLDGYIKMLIPFAEAFAWVKPTLLLQKAVLDTALTSRLPVPFKTVDGELLDVFISELEITEDGKVDNANKIHAVVQEIPSLFAEEGTLASAVSSAKSAAFSLPTTAYLGIGMASVAVAPAVSGIASSIDSKEQISEEEVQNV